jgi:hydrogenase maturation protein HypF
MKNRRKSGAYTSVCEHFEEIFHSRSAKNERSHRVVNSYQRFRILITGQVQGVGFRPYVYRLAKQFNLTGWVQNNANGVVIEIQGLQVANFIINLTTHLPPLACVDSLQTMEIILEVDEQDFIIKKSETGDITTKISPDVKVCDLCLQELFDSNSRFYLYPFLNFTHCGPRLTITERLPYDRMQTSMREFSLCDVCKNDYNDPNNRRYHAQPTACSKCGPQLSIPIAQIVQNIMQGEIVAIKGMGGYQLICDAKNETAILKLRARKNRETKPFAIMFANIMSAKNFVECSLEDEKLLESSAAPIVLLQKNSDKLPEALAPGLSHLGVMLANTPLHYLLFHAFAGYPDNANWLQQFQPTVLVVTSANPGGNPLVIDDIAAQQLLQPIADKIVSYNREILTRADDSVMGVVNNTAYFIRRARGYVPASIKLAHAIPCTLGVGGYLKNTFCVARGDDAFVSQHIGDLENPATIEFFHESLDHLLKILDVRPQRIAHDLHPDFYTTHFAQQYAAENNIPIFPVQHHHAHLAAVMAEHHVREPAIGLALDGYGYGSNGSAWGGELLLLDGTDFKKLGALKSLPMPGGDAAALEPWRMAVSVLNLLQRKDFIKEHYAPKFPVEGLLQMLNTKLNSPLTSSCGRLYDAASALLGIQMTSQYEGQAAMKLEALVTKPEILDNGWCIESDQLNLLPLLEYLLQCDPITGANIFHGTLIAALTAWLETAKKQFAIKTVLLSGGCFLNRVLSKGLFNSLKDKGFTVYLPQQLPPNDGGISLGQVWIAGNSLCV